MAADHGDVFKGRGGSPAASGAPGKRGVKPAFNKRGAEDALTGLLLASAQCGTAAKQFARLYQNTDASNAAYAGVEKDVLKDLMIGHYAAGAELGNGIWALNTQFPYVGKLTDKVREVVNVCAKPSQLVQHSREGHVDAVAAQTLKEACKAEDSETSLTALERCGRVMQAWADANAETLAPKVKETLRDIINDYTEAVGHINEHAAYVMGYAEQQGITAEPLGRRR